MYLDGEISHLGSKVEDSKFPFNVEPTNESFQLLIIQSLKSFAEKVGHEPGNRQRNRNGEMAAENTYTMHVHSYKLQIGKH